MEGQLIRLCAENIGQEHICCAFSDKKCREGYELKKKWLTQEFGNGFVFCRLDARAEVFIEFMPAEKRGVPLQIFCLSSMEKVRKVLSPATVFSLFYQ